MMYLQLIVIILVSLGQQVVLASWTIRLDNFQIIAGDTDTPVINIREIEMYNGAVIVIPATKYMSTVFNSMDIDA